MLDLQSTRPYSSTILRTHFVTGQIETPRFARFPLHATRPNDRFMRLADWWPAALVGLLALVGAVPDSNAQTILGLL
jgi:hypothetical protein